MGNAQLKTSHLVPQEDKPLHPQLRDAELRDFQDVIELMYDFDCTHYELRPGYYKKPRKPGRSKRYILNAMMNPLEKLYIFDQEGVIKGLVHLRINPFYERHAIVAKRTVTVLEIVVKDPEANPAVGVAMSEAVIKFAEDSGCADIHADVDDKNIRAQKFVTRNGLQPVSIRYIRDMRVTEKDRYDDTQLTTRLYRKWIQLKIRLFALFWRP